MLLRSRTSKQMKVCETMMHWWQEEDRRECSNRMRKGMTIDRPLRIYSPSSPLNVSQSLFLPFLERCCDGHAYTKISAST